MKNNIKYFFILLTCVTSTLFASVSKNQIEKIQNLNIFIQSGIQVKKVIDLDSFYAVDVMIKSGARDTIFVTKDLNYLIPGDAINTTNGVKLEIPKDMSILKNKQAFSFGTGKKKYILFTDPECPYCKKFESYFPLIKDKVTIDIFFYPLSHHSSAYDLSLYIMSQKTNKEKLNTMLKTSVDDSGFKNRNIAPKFKEELEKSLNIQIDLASQIGVQGTPMLYDNNGNKVNWILLLKELGIEVQ